MAQNFPPINKVFDDLDKFRDFCRFENRGYPFDEKDLYCEGAFVWEAYKKHQNYLRAKARNDGKPFERRPRPNNPNPRFNNSTPRVENDRSN